MGRGKGGWMSGWEDRDDQTRGKDEKKDSESDEGGREGYVSKKGLFFPYVHGMSIFER